MAYTLTPGYESARMIADIALTEPEGVKLLYPSAKYGSFVNAKKEARKFQTNFSSMRAFLRKKVNAEVRGDELYLGVRAGPYDKLACVTSELPRGEGVEVRVVPQSMINLSVEVLSIATGKPIEQLSPDQRRMEAAVEVQLKEVNAAVKEGRKCRKLWSEELEVFMFAFNPEGAEGLYEWGKLERFGQRLEVQPHTPTPRVDWSDSLSMDEFFAEEPAPPSGGTTPLGPHPEGEE